MGAMSRRKGQGYEREVHAALSDELGFVVRRNAATRARPGDPDGTEIPGWAVEAKRCEREALSSWWAQAVEQAVALGRKPVLFFRPNRQKTRAAVGLKDISPLFDSYGDGFAVMEFQAACKVIRESL